jgi:ubiquinol-cytochrome c reductase cytochrome c1 subunit
MNRLTLTIAAGLISLASVVQAQEAPQPPHVSWSFDGVFGTFDRAQLKRGWQVFKEVCSACHSAHQLYYRNLVEGDIFTEGEAKDIAAADQVPAGPNDSGDIITDGQLNMRPAQLSDKIAQPFNNEKAARAANGGALPPDLSLIVKARKGGADYVHAILTGFHDAPAGFTLQQGMNYNEYFRGHQIAMPPPLSDGRVTYADGTQANVDQMAKDVAAFLSWSSEPEMEARKRLGVKVLAFLLVLTALLYAVKRKVWEGVH